MDTTERADAGEVAAEPRPAPRSAADVFADIEALLGRGNRVIEWPADEIDYSRNGFATDDYDPTRFGGLPGWRSFTERADNLTTLRAHKVLVLAGEYAVATAAEATREAVRMFRARCEVISTLDGVRHLSNPDAGLVHTAREALCSESVYGRVVDGSEPGSAEMTCRVCEWKASKAGVNGARS